MNNSMVDKDLEDDSFIEFHKNNKKTKSKAYKYKHDDHLKLMKNMRISNENNSNLNNMIQDKSLLKPKNKRKIGKSSS
jgi:hypothetical protein